MSSQDHRHFQRLSVPLPATLNWQGQGIGAKVIDLSLKGVLIEPGRELPETASLATAMTGGIQPQVELVLLSDPEHIELLRVTVELIHHQDGRFGGQWTNISVEELAKLRQILDYNLGSDQGIERELSELWH